jgi:hypothetical protein
MANKSSEHRMLFDIQGKRKRVVQVVYALLAVLMGLSLFTVVGPSAGFLGDIFGTNSSSTGASIYDDQATKLQAQLRKDPNNQQDLLLLSRARYNAGQQLLISAQQSGSGDPTAILNEFQKSADSWDRYLATHPAKPSLTLAPLVAQAYSILTRFGSTSASDFRHNAKSGAEAQRLATQAKPTVNNLFLLAQAEYLAFNYAAGDKAGKQAAQKTPATQRKVVSQQLAQARTQAKKQEKQVAAAAKVEAKQGKQQLQQGSLGGLSGGGAGLTGGGLSGAP